ncbi:MAG TPA: hypothetical protein VFL27_05910 [Candidatus Dormibacteraeota bacterium]|nr:hypothetical protein [Candidatus Dormibacteraeota bacterium]
MVGPVTSGGFLLGLFAILLGIGAVAAAMRRRRARALYPETYAASGGIAYTIVQVGCGGALLLGGVGLVALAVIFRR